MVMRVVLTQAPLLTYNKTIQEVADEAAAHAATEELLEMNVQSWAHSSPIRVANLS